MYYLFALIALIVLLLTIYVLKRKIVVGVWSIKVFDSKSFVSDHPHEKLLERPTLQAADVTDAAAEFVADPFIISHNNSYYMFFEVLDKASNKGVIGLATSEDGETWNYNKIVLKENYHLSYPYVFKFHDDYYMVPETSEANGVFLYKAKNFPYDWAIDRKLINGKYVDASIFPYNDKWWMYAAKRGKLHLFYTDSDDPRSEWNEHPESPVIANNNNITRPGGRVIVDNGHIYRYTQDGEPNYGSAVRVFKITKLSDEQYREEEAGLVLSGSNREKDWRKSGMHTIDQLKISDDKWLIAVDGHKLEKRAHLLWKLDYIFQRSLYAIKRGKV